MAKVIRELAARLSLQADSFNNSIKASMREMKEFEKTFKPSLTLAKDLGTGMAAAGGAVVVGMLAATKSAVDFGDAINDARQRTGIAVETLAKFGFAAQQSGSDVGALAIGFKGLANNMQAAEAGGKSQLEAFGALGISAKDLAAAHGDMEKVMLLVADRFSQMEDGAAKSALAVDIFGRAGTGLIPMLNEGSAGLKTLGDQAQAAGLVMSQETALASDKLNDSINELKASVLGASLAIAEPLVPILQDLAEKAIAGTQAFAGFIKEHQGLTVAVAALAGTAALAGGSLATLAVIGPKIKEGWLMVQAFGSSLGALAIANGPILLTVGALVTLGVELFKLAGAWRDSITAQGGAAVAMANTETSALKAAKALKDTYGIEVQRGNLGIKEFTEAISAASQSAEWFAAKTREVAPPLKGWSDAAKYLAEQVDPLNVKVKTQAELLADLTAFMKKNTDAAAALATKQKEAADALKTLNDGFLASLKPADGLWVILDKLNDTWSNKDIIKIYGDQIIEATKRQREHGEKIDANVLALEKMALAARNVAAATAAIKIPTPAGYANPTPDNKKDPYGGYDPLGLYKNALSPSATMGQSLTGIAAQPALPAALNLGGGSGGPLSTTPHWAGGFPGNGSFYWPEDRKPQGTSTMSGITVNSNVAITVTPMTTVDDINNQLARGLGLDEMARRIYDAQRGLTSSKGA